MDLVTQLSDSLAVENQPRGTNMAQCSPTDYRAHVAHLTPADCQTVVSTVKSLVSQLMQYSTGEYAFDILQDSSRAESTFRRGKASTEVCITMQHRAVDPVV